MAATGSAEGRHPARTEQARGDQARVARMALADFLRDTTGMDRVVEAAFRQVPRHLFVPELQPQLVYQDESVVVKVAQDGTPVSSSSQPTMMAIMLGQLGLERGHHVLEIGAGTGYNAALMAHIVGDKGRVVTVDIDAELSARASASLAAAGYGRVKVACADGALGFAQDAPYDRIMLTAGAWDMATHWIDQLKPDGRIVLPLSIRGLQLSVALDRTGQFLTSRSAVRCGFIRLAGALAGPEVLTMAGARPGARFATDDGRPLDGEAVYAALTGPAVVVLAELPDVSQAELSDADLWLTLAEPELVRLSAFGGDPVAGALRPLGGLAEAGRADGRLGIAAVSLGPPGPAGAQSAADLAESSAGGSHGARGPVGGRGAAGGRGPVGGRGPAGDCALLVRGYGPSGTELAGYLAARVGTWHRLGRPGIEDLRLRVYPASEPDASLADESGGSLIFRRPQVTLVADWSR